MSKIEAASKILALLEESGVPKGSWGDVLDIVKLEIKSPPQPRKAGSSSKKKRSSPPKEEKKEEVPVKPRYLKDAEVALKEHRKALKAQCKASGQERLPEDHEMVIRGAELLDSLIAAKQRFREEGA